MIGQTLAPGEAEGAPLKLDEPLSFWGGLDPATGLIMDRWHPQVGLCVLGRVLLMPGGRGSSSGSAVLAEAIRRGMGPAAILLTRRDPIVIVGALVATELYGLACPAALVQGYEALASAARVRVLAGLECAEISEIA